LSQTEFGADLIPLMSVARLRHTRHACSVDPYVSMMQEGYIAVSESQLMRSYGAISRSVPASIGREARHVA
jgi:hypothetical protein